MLIYDKRGKLVAVAGSQSENEEWASVNLESITGNRIRIGDKNYFACTCT